MKSQVIHARNIPHTEIRPYVVHVKPVWGLTAFLILGIAMMFSKGPTAIKWIGLWIGIVCIYAQLFLPDRILLMFFDEFMVMNNQRGSECTIVYYDEIVKWKYEYHPSGDMLVLSLVDDTTYSIELFSKLSISKVLNQYCKGKEAK